MTLAIGYFVIFIILALDVHYHVFVNKRKKNIPIFAPFDIMTEQYSHQPLKEEKPATN